MYVRQKPNMTRYQCKTCYKTFKNKMMKDFQKRSSPCQLYSKDCEDNFNDEGNLDTGIKCKYESECRSKLELQIHLHLQTGEQMVDSVFELFSRVEILLSKFILFKVVLNQLLKYSQTN